MEIPPEETFISIAREVFGISGTVTLVTILNMLMASRYSPGGTG
jgi:hypothetical protein